MDQDEIHSPFQEGFTFPVISAQNTSVRNLHFIAVYEHFFVRNSLNTKTGPNSAEFSHVEKALIANLLDIMKAEGSNYFILRKSRIFDTLMSVFDSKQVVVQVIFILFTAGIDSGDSWICHSGLEVYSSHRAYCAVIIFTWYQFFFLFMQNRNLLKLWV
jgi:hypothetical protein